MLCQKQHWIETAQKTDNRVHRCNFVVVAVAKQQLSLLRRKAQIQIANARIELFRQCERLRFCKFFHMERRKPEELYRIVRCIFAIGRCTVMCTGEVDLINVPTVRDARHPVFTVQAVLTDSAGSIVCRISAAEGQRTYQ